MERGIEAAQVTFAGSKVVEAVRALQPYPTGNQMLFELHRLDVRDKHHVLVLSQRTADITAGDMGKLLGVPISGPATMRYNGPEDNDIAFTRAVSSNSEVGRVSSIVLQRSRS